MQLKTKLFERWRQKAIAAGVVALLGLAFWGFRFTEGLAHFSYDLPFALRPDVHPEEVVMVLMDDESRQRLHQPVQGAWDRAAHLQLLNALFARGATAVVFDVWLDEPWPDKAVDEQFAAAIRSHGRVVLGASYKYSGGDGEPIVGRLRLAVEPLRSAAAWGVAELPVDSDGTIREHASDDQYTNMAWQAVAVLGRTLGERVAPRWINYYGPSGTVPHASYYKVLETDALSSELFSNKIVFVGKAPIINYQGSTSTDEFRTPYTRWSGINSPGVEIHATACLNFLRRDWLSRLPLWIELSLILGAALALVFVLPLFRFGVAVGMAAACSLAIAAVAVIMAQYLPHFHWWFNWAVITFVEAPAAVGWMALVILNRRPPEPALVSVIETDEDKLPEDGLPGIPEHQMLRRFGEGSYGEVWLARNVHGTYRAVKIVFRNKFPNDKPFEREFKGTQAFEPISRSHEGFVDILQVGRREKAGYFYYVMELADDQSHGETIDPERYVPKTLASELKQREKLPCEECVRIGLLLADALQMLHDKKLLHRDIKPSNIIFVGGIPKLADIGLVAKEAEAESFVGTEGFIPPEGPGTVQADIFSLGKVLYEIAMGRDRSCFPVLPTTLTENPEREQLMALNDVLLKACEANPKRRYSSARKLHAALKRLSTKLTKAKNQSH